MQNKLKITQKEIDDIYEIEEITGENTSPKVTAKPTQEDDTTPTSVLTAEEQIIDDEFHSHNPEVEEK